ncbi:hypothetical protein [Wukongibacter sp. M2B1]|uniref:hypothetical protein n=1 Tax=Wukongibacter sp. M2B1 TaxID=3088895 RepID=UPI003D7B2DFF
MITVSAERVRKKARIDDTYDADIQETIDEHIPYIESKIRDIYLNSEDNNIKSIINLGATEIITGEFIKEQANDEEDGVSLGVGPIKISDNSVVKTRSTRAQNFIDSGWEKLKPYLKATNVFYFASVEG